MVKKKNFNDWTKEELIKEVQILTKKKSYGIVWEKDETKELFDYYINWDGEETKEKFGDEEGKFPVLKEIKNRSIDNKDSKYNIMIEGDNYHSLAVLNFTHNKAIDVIYIDPPYNTGNGDFIYNDKIVDSEDQYRHSKWLNFMEKRLKLACNVLKNTGIIFISIDDHEMAQLKLLCDNIFGEKNFVTNMIWKSRPSLQYSEPLICSQTEYVLVYVKNRTLWNLRAMDFNNLDEGKSIAGHYLNRIKKPFDVRGYSNPDNDKNGPWLSSGKVRDDGRPSHQVISPTGVKHTKPWIYSPEIFKKLDKAGLIYWGKNGSAQPRKKSYLKDFKGNVSSNLLMDEFIYAKGDSSEELKKEKVWEIGTTEKGTKELKEILAKNSFDYPKPKELLSYLINLHPNKDALILDFMAGSGTTGHAVMELNKEDGGNRKFILCTNNESNNGTGLKIAEDICYPRIKKLIEGYNDAKGESIEGYKDNFKYLKTDFVDSAPTDENKKKIMDKSTEMLCIKENAFKPIIDKKGYKIFKNTDIYLGIIFDEEQINKFVNDAKKIKGNFHVYVFSFDDSVPEEEFKDMKGRIKLCPIPEVILHVYRRILK